MIQIEFFNCLIKYNFETYFDLLLLNNYAIRINNKKYIIGYFFFLKTEDFNCMKDNNNYISRNSDYDFL